MNWEAVGSIAEVVGALGVVVSLLYLALQIRMQNRQTRLEIVNELARQRNEYSGNIADNGELAEIWFRGLSSYDELPELERVRFSAHIARMVRVMESLYQHRTEDQFAGENWDAFERYIRDVFSYEGAQQWWQTRSGHFTKPFQAHIAAHISASDKQASVYGESRERTVSPNERL
ncbi:MAG: hypothetical protein ACU84Q_17015 [Gammaproteobacteria bacterium]